MINEDLIRNRLDDPAIEVQKIDEDGMGAFANVVVDGIESKARRLIPDEFDIEGTKGMPEGTHARLRPKW